MPNCRECNLSEGRPTKMYCTADIPWVVTYAYGPEPVDISIPATMEWMEHECPCFEPMNPSLPDGTQRPSGLQAGGLEGPA